LLYLLGISIVEPLLVACGFALYLNRRIFLEGWDIDLAFRHLASRAAPRRVPSRQAAALLMAALLTLVAPARAGARACAAADPDDPSTAARCIEEILASDDFGSTEERAVWRAREIDTPGLDWAAPSWLGEWIAAAFQVAGWLLLGGSLLALAVAIARRGEPSRTGAARTPTGANRPERRFGLDLAPESLPGDLTGAARAAWAEGRTTFALSLLYRGALIRLVDHHGLVIPESATELECVALVTRAPERRASSLFHALTAAWVGARYAARPPADEAFDALCDGFDRAFGAAP
jgi:hypothetical protein